MPTCQKCHTVFPNRVVVDGVKRNIQNRRQCLSCSPFKSGGRLRTVTEGETLTCTSCGRGYVFHKDNRGGHTLTRCNSCSCNTRRVDRKAQAVEYLGGMCKVCGYKKCHAALSFHHVTGEKDFVISGRYTCSWETLKAELDKCVLVCQNCHLEIHAGVTPCP